jgi:hypothetical protein
MGGSADFGAEFAWRLDAVSRRRNRRVCDARGDKRSRMLDVVEDHKSN